MRLHTRWKLRTSMAAVAAAAIVMGAFAAHRRGQATPARALAAIRKLGGITGQWSVSFGKCAIVYDGEPDEIVNLAGRRVTDEDLIYVSRLTNLKILVLSNTNVTDAGLAHLSRLKNLRTLRIRATRITDAGIESLKKALPSLGVER